MNTSSFGFPNMFDVARNKVAISADKESITSRVKLLLLTDPTELHMNPTYGVGLRKYLFQYNNDNVIARIRDDLIDQLRLWEPCVDPDATQVTRGLEFTGSQDSPEVITNQLNLTIKLQSIYGDEVEINISDYSL